jgi:hypothetical protein
VAITGNPLRLLHCLHILEGKLRQPYPASHPSRQPTSELLQPSLRGSESGHQPRSQPLTEALATSRGLAGGSGARLAS